VKGWKEKSLLRGKEKRRSKDNDVSSQTHISSNPFFLIFRFPLEIPFKKRRQFYFKGRTNLFCIKMK